MAYRLSMVADAPMIGEGAIDKTLRVPLWVIREF